MASIIYSKVCPKCRERFTHFLEKDVDRQVLGRNVRCREALTAANALVTELRHLDKR